MCSCVLWSVKRNVSVLTLLTIVFFHMGVSIAKGSSVCDSILVNKVEKIELEVSKLNNWKNAQQEIIDITNKRIDDNFTNLDRLSNNVEVQASRLSIWISAVTIIITILNIGVGFYMVIAQRALRRETKEINEDTKAINTELNRKTEELYKEMLQAKFGNYNTVVRDEIARAEESRNFEDLSYKHKLIRIDYEFDKGNIEEAIKHCKSLLIYKKNLDYLYNRIGIGYVKLNLSEQACKYFELAYNAPKAKKSKYVLNLLERYIVLNDCKKAMELIRKSNRMSISDESLPVLFTLKFALYVKMEDKRLLDKLKIQKNDVNWNYETHWEFESLKDCFKQEYANDFRDIFTFAKMNDYIEANDHKLNN